MPNITRAEKNSGFAKNRDIVRVFSIDARGKKKREAPRKMPSGWVPAKTTKFSFIRPYLAFIDNLLLYLIKVVPCVRKGEYVICDRFIWDNHARILVKPKIGMIFDLPSKIAVKRVGKRGSHYQYAVEQYEIEREEFKRIGEKLNYTVIRTNQPLEKTWKEIENYLLQFIKT